MYGHRSIVAVSLLVTMVYVGAAWGASLLERRATLCPAEYRAISSEHTMCMTDVGTILTLTQAEKDAAVAEHNKIRARVSPKAANMRKLTWNEDLAKVAAKWAAQCTVGHDKIRSVPSLPGVYVGQNMAAGNQDLVGATRAWESEIKDFHYGGRPTGVVGHYTQIVYADTDLVGCGVASCPRSKYRKFQICNYAVGQMNDAHTRPYSLGTNGCDNCRDSCDSTGNLCDCGGKMCLNGGTLDISSCQCQCTNLYKGDLCQTLNCTPDDETCPLYVKYYGNNVCKEFYNVPPLCPYMCGICKE